MPSGVELNTASAFSASARGGGGARRWPSAWSRIATRMVPFPIARQFSKSPAWGPVPTNRRRGFLRGARGSDHPLDASAVHPERYALVERMADDLGGAGWHPWWGARDLVERIDSKQYVDEAGRFTFNDIINELKKPGRDPRAVFEAPNFRDDVAHE